jgi:hypothetical protein
MICSRLISYVIHDLQETWQGRGTSSDRNYPVTQADGKQKMRVVWRTTRSINHDSFAHLDFPPHLRLHPLGNHLVLRKAFQDEDERVGSRSDTR